MTNTIYKVDTNFFETPLDIGFQSDKPIEWELNLAIEQYSKKGASFFNNSFKKAIDEKHRK
jgi:hypothetical protein